MKQFAIDRLKEYEARIKEELSNIRAWKKLVRSASKQRRPMSQKDLDVLNSEQVEIAYNIWRRLFSNE